MTGALSYHTLVGWRCEPRASRHPNDPVIMRSFNARSSACAVDVEASCGGSCAPDPPLRGLCRRAPRIPLAAPDGGSVCSPLTHPFGHQLPGSLPQRIAEVCPMPTSLVLSYLTDLARRRLTTQSGWRMITHRAPAGDSQRGLVPPGDTRPTIVTYLKARCAPP